jgi:microcompartment protein CcmL/EutN
MKSDEVSLSALLDKGPKMAIGCIEVKSVPTGYRALDLLTKTGVTQILEAAPVGGGVFMILVEGGEADLRSSIQTLRSSLEAGGLISIVDSEVIEGAASDVLVSAYSLAQQKLQESLVVIECQTISGLLSSQRALEIDHGLCLIETKIYRSGQAGGYGFATGPSLACASAVVDIRTRLQNSMRQGNLDVIDQPVADFRNYFNLSGEA